MLWVEFLFFIMAKKVDRSQIKLLSTMYLRGHKGIRAGGVETVAKRGKKKKIVTKAAQGWRTKMNRKPDPKTGVVAERIKEKAPIIP